MEKTKSLRDVSWQVDETTYRKDKALSYSTLSKYEREGFSKLDSLFDHVSTPSLTLGSCVDAWITGGYEEFEERFLVASYPKLSDNLQAIAGALYRDYGKDYASLLDIPDELVSSVAKTAGFWAADKWDRIRPRKVKEEEGCAEYYRLMREAGGRTVIDGDTFNDVKNMVSRLKDSEATSWYFAPDNPFEPGLERLYQLKFKANLKGVDYRCMADLIVVDYDHKVITPCDLKTTGKPEYEFFHSFDTYNYHIQARLYWRIIRHVMDGDDYFRDFELGNYKFIVVNRTNLDPMVWSFPDTKAYGTLSYGKEGKFVFRDPFEIGKELDGYLAERPKRPNGIKDDNDVVAYLNEE